MPIAAVPGYLGQDFSDASPGMRFGMYLPIWTERADQETQIRKMAGAGSQEGRELARILETAGMDAAIEHVQRNRGRFPRLWEKNDHAANKAWSKVAKLARDDCNRMTALTERQSALVSALGCSDQLFVLDARAVAPFTTGLGNEHPLENGFAFLWPYGLPYLPGSGVKGVLRQAARELVSGEWAGLSPQTGENRPTHPSSESEKNPSSPSPSGRGVGEREKATWTADAITALFGSYDSDQPRRGALTFWDVIPRIEGDKLMVEVMTGHQSHYYMNSQPPHESGRPIPVYFLTVPPGSGFTFHVVCDLPFLRRAAPELAESDRWRSLLRQAFEHAFAWLGFGAKTAVGYGAMVRDESAARAREEQEQKQTIAQLSPEERAITELRRIFEEERSRGRLAAGGQTAQKRLELLKFAETWNDPALKKAAAALIRETLQSLPWSRNQKRQRVSTKLAELEQDN